MTGRERFLAVLNGGEPDRIPWFPRLEIWYRAHEAQDTLPQHLKGKSLMEVERELGCNHPARQGRVARTELRGIDVIEDIDSRTLTRTYRTPLGDVSEVYQLNPDAQRRGDPFSEGLVKHLIESEGDYDIVSYIIENTHYEPWYEEYERYDREVGDNGYPSVNLGEDPFYSMLRYYIGFQNAYYHLYDHLGAMEKLYAVLVHKMKELQAIALESPATLFIHGQHYDSQMTPRPLYEKYIQPYLRDFADKLHARGKKLAVHADADLSQLLSNVPASGVDMVECFCTAPMVPCRIEDAIDAWGDGVIIWGGIPSIMLCPASCSEEAFREFVERTLRIVAGRRNIILGVADNVMPEADIERVRFISEQCSEQCARGTEGSA